MPNFGELRKAEVQLLRISLPRTPVNKKLVVRCVLVEDRGGGQGWRTRVEDRGGGGAVDVLLPL
jgi:hypothetical protein